MKKIVILDPSVGTQNVGDEIIHDATTTQVERIFPGSFFMRISTHEFMLWESRKILKKADHIFVAGSNLLKSKMEWNTQWKLSPWDLLSLRNVVLVGCGWRHYDGGLTPYTKLLYKSVLSPKGLHSLRDQFSADQLTRGGINNAINTACVTMWDLSPEHCASIPKQKAQDAVCTLTAYHPDKKNDRAMLEALLSNYRTVHFFAQQPEDLDYAQGLAGGRLAPISPTLAAYDKILSTDVDYIGTRLHGGIRALQKGKRTLIVAIDNRAIEISKDTNLPTITREDCQKLPELLTQPLAVDLKLPAGAIAQWRSQFSNAAA
jgi:polysaccharide pyruvyl transferase WcaK-like protein